MVLEMIREVEKVSVFPLLEMSDSYNGDCDLSILDRSLAKHLYSEEIAEGIKEIEDSEIYNLSGAEFDDHTIELLRDNELMAATEIFGEDKWEKLNNEERKSEISKFGHILGNKLGLNTIPKIEFINTDRHICGAFIKGIETVQINENNFDNPKEILDTLSHEFYHAYQHEHAEKPRCKKDYAYAKNFLPWNYVRPYRDLFGVWHNYVQYERQLVEIEASSFGRLMSDEISRSSYLAYEPEKNKVAIRFC